MENNNNTNNIVNLNLIQSLFKFNKLDNGETCLGLRHWSLLPNLKNNFSKPVRNDMDNKRRLTLLSRQLNKLDCFAFARNDEKTVKNLFPYFPISLSPKKNVAFTLAEVLITLGIIGIVAAITIPGLISNKQKTEIETKLREDYSIIQQSMKMSENDGLAIDPYMPEPVQEIQKWFDTFLAPYMKYSNACVEKKGCWQSDGPTKNLAGEIAYCSRTGIGVGYGILTMRLINGTNLNFDSYSKEDAKRYLGLITTNKVLAIFIDVNGDRKPNIIGKDIFIAILTEDGIVPAGISESNEKVDENCSSNSTDINAGYYCLLKVKNNGWKIPNDVWGKKI